MQHTFFPNKFRTSIFLNLTCKQFWPTCSLWVVVSLSEFLGWRFVRSFLSFSSTVRVLLSHRLGQVCIFGTTGDIPCPSVLSNKVAGQSQFSTPYDHLFRTIRSFFFSFQFLTSFFATFQSTSFFAFFFPVVHSMGSTFFYLLTPPAANIARLDHLLFSSFCEMDLIVSTDLDC